YFRLHFSKASETMDRPRTPDMSPRDQGGTSVRSIARILMLVAMVSASSTSLVAGAHATAAQAIEHRPSAAISLPGIGTLRIAIDATGAVHPVTTRPLALSADWSGESDQASAWYGYSVNTAGDVNGDGYSDVI